MLERSLATILVGLSLLACAPRGAPEVPSGASQPAYALQYGARLDSLARAFGEKVKEPKHILDGQREKFAEWKKPQWDLLLEMLDAADAAGGRAGFAEGYREARALRTFWSEEKDALGSAVSGHAQFAAKKSGCSGDVGGAAAFGLKESFAKQSDKRLRSHNDAILILERRRGSLPKGDIPYYERFADDIAYARYVASVELRELHFELSTRLAEQPRVLSALDRFAEDEKTFRGAPGRTASDRKGSDERLSAASKSREEAVRAHSRVAPGQKDRERQVREAESAHREALAELRRELLTKAGGK